MTAYSETTFSMAEDANPQVTAAMSANYVFVTFNVNGQELRMGWTPVDLRLLLLEGVAAIEKAAHV